MESPFPRAAGADPNWRGFIANLAGTRVLFVTRLSSVSARGCEHPPRRIGSKLGGRGCSCRAGCGEMGPGVHGAFSWSAVTVAAPSMRLTLNRNLPPWIVKSTSSSVSVPSRRLPALSVITHSERRPDAKTTRPRGDSGIMHKRTGTASTSRGLKTCHRWPRSSQCARTRWTAAPPKLIESFLADAWISSGRSAAFSPSRGKREPSSTPRRFNSPRSARSLFSICLPRTSGPRRSVTV